MTSDPTSKILSVATASLWALVAMFAWIGYGLRHTKVELLLAILSTVAAALWLAAVLVTKTRAKAPAPINSARVDGS